MVVFAIVVIVLLFLLVALTRFAEVAFIALATALVIVGLIAVSAKIRRQNFKLKSAALVSLAAVTAGSILVGLRVEIERLDFAHACVTPQQFPASRERSGVAILDLDNQLRSLLPKDGTANSFAAKSITPPPNLCSGTQCNRSNENLIFQAKLTALKSVLLPTFQVEYIVRSAESGTVYASTFERVQTWGHFSMFRPFRLAADEQAWSCGYISQQVNEFRGNQDRYIARDKWLLGQGNL